jgi:hypothetical protein
MNPCREERWRRRKNSVSDGNVWRLQKRDGAEATGKREREVEDAKCLLICDGHNE